MKAEATTLWRGLFIVLIVAFVIVIALSAMPAKAGVRNVYYVAPYGNDGNAGTEASPFRTIQSAADVAQAGDTVIVKDGIYQDSNGDQAIVVVRNAGTAEAWITFKSENKWGAVIQARHDPEDARWGFLFAHTARYIRVEGFELRRENGRLLPEERTENSGYAAFWANYSIVNDQRVCAHHIEIASNYIHDLHGGMYQGSNCNDYLFDSNVFERVGRLPGADPVRDYNHDHGLYLTGNRIRITNNLFIDHQAGWGVHIWGYDPISDAEVINNTFIGANPERDGQLILGGYISDVLIQNNLFYEPRGTPLNIPCNNGKVTTVTTKNNLTTSQDLYSSWTTENQHYNQCEVFVTEGNLRAADPALVAPESGNYHLSATSAAVDAGLAVSAPELDYDGIVRPQGNGVDIGAYELAATPTPTFADVPFNHWAHDYIEVLYQEGYIAGCSTDPLMYCPEQTMTRAEIAVFVERGLHGADFDPSHPTEVVFIDVTLHAWYADWVHQLWDDGYTAGCSADPLAYCPEQGHSRAEGCVFFLRMMHGVDYIPPDPEGIFTDVPLDWWGAKWVEAAYSAGLIPACETQPALKFCPNDPLDRAMGAYMMVQAKGLEVP